MHSIVFHEVKPDKVDEYVKLVGGWYPRIASMPENKVHLVGSWRTEVGDCDTFGECITFLCDRPVNQSVTSLANTYMQSISGSTSDTKAITRRLMLFNTTLNSPNLIIS